MTLPAFEAIARESNPGMATGNLEGVRQAQRAWAGTALRDRLAMIRLLRWKAAAGARKLAETVPLTLPGSLHRTVADTLVSEVLPLLEACRFLEREAGRILGTRRLGRRGRPVWLRGFAAEIEPAPRGVVLVLGAANYPLFLAGVQTLQALVAGNAVLWKPAPGTAAAAHALRDLLVESGLNAALLTVLDTPVESAVEAIAGGVDYAVLTGSAETGKAVLRQLAETLTPAAMELSGCDAVFVLPGADFSRTVEALRFGLRFNGSFTCMAPRRVFLVGIGEAAAVEFEERLADALQELSPMPLPDKTRIAVREMTADARARGSEVVLDGLSEGEQEARATLIVGAGPGLRAMREDVFAPILSVMRTAGLDEALAAHAACPYGLTASIFGPEDEARGLASRLRVGNVSINDLIVPTADARIPFGGRGRSGFGVTRGAEGLLAMTTPRTIQVQRAKSMRAYDATGDGHVGLFAGLAQVLHGDGLAVRWAGLKRVVRAARGLK